jgi:hypothetical protein
VCLKERERRGEGQQRHRAVLWFGAAGQVSEGVRHRERGQGVGGGAEAAY